MIPPTARTCPPWTCGTVKLKLPLPFSYMAGLFLSIALSCYSCVGFCLCFCLQLRQVLAIFTNALPLVNFLGIPLANLERMHLLKFVLVVVEDVGHRKCKSTQAFRILLPLPFHNYVPL